MGCMEEREAIARLQRGDIDGLEVLVRRYQALALKAVLLTGGDYALAEDIVQAAFIRAYERIDQFDPARPFGPWFLRGVVNDTLKALGRHRTVSLDEALAVRADRFAADDAELDALLAAETQEAVWAALDRLAPEQCAVVVLRYYLDMSAAEVAIRLDRPPGTIRRRLHDARERLRGMLPAWERPSSLE
jgi:RNA polymerase sigma-70 factor (ECF subfamily)